MRVAFRVDGSRLIGSGHLFRCATLAREFSKQGHEVHFLCRTFDDAFAPILGDIEFRVTLLAKNGDTTQAGDLAHSAWLGTSQDIDALDTIQAVVGQQFDLLVVDHYALDSRWETALRPYVARILVIDDLADRRHSCDFLLDQNYFTDFAGRYTALVAESCTLLLGPAYALIRPEFFKLRKITAKSSGHPHVFVFFGGADVAFQTAKALDALDMLGVPLAVSAVIGAKHPREHELAEYCSTRGWSLHVATPRIAEIMARCDLAIGASGTTSWERCTLGLPSVLLSLADNQIAVAEALHYTGAAIYLGKGENVPAQELSACVKSLLSDPDLIEAMSFKAQVVAGSALGPAGIAAVCQVRADSCPPIILRMAALSDAQRLYDWRNDTATRAASLNQEPVEWEAHKDWLDRTLRAMNKALFIGSTGAKPVGSVRFDRHATGLELSWTVAPDMRGRGLGKRLVAEAIQWAKGRHVTATIKEDNLASQEIARHAGMLLVNNLSGLTYWQTAEAL